MNTTVEGCCQKTTTTMQYDFLKSQFRQEKLKLRLNQTPLPCHEVLSYREGTTLISV